MKKLIGAAVGVAALTCATPAFAQLGIEGNGARADDRWGAEIGVGYAITLLPGLKVTPAAGVLVYAEENDRYRRDPVGNSSRCRDTSNGQFADDERCDNTAVKPYGRIEATYNIPLIAMVGAGVRIGDEVKPYGTVGFPILPRLQLKGNVGDDYYALGLRLGF